MDGRRVVQSNGILACALKEPRRNSEPVVGPIARCWRPCQYFGPPVHHRDRTSSEQMPVYLRDTFGRLRTRFRFALLFSRAFFVGLCIDLFREFGQLFVSFCFFFEGLLQ